MTRKTEKTTLHVCTKEAEIEVIKNDIQQLKKLTEAIHSSVVGDNSGPGVNEKIAKIKAIQDQQDKILEKHCTVIENLNVKLGYYAGGIAALTFIITISTKMFW